MDSDTDEEEGGSSLEPGEDQEHEHEQEPEMEEDDALEIQKLEVGRLLVSDSRLTSPTGDSRSRQN